HRCRSGGAGGDGEEGPAEASLQVGAAAGRLRPEADQHAQQGDGDGPAEPAREEPERAGLAPQREGRGLLAGDREAGDEQAHPGAEDREPGDAGRDHRRAGG
ncbi:MAG: hypothetical protein ACK559_07295, partial [bacterium]